MDYVKANKILYITQPTSAAMDPQGSQSSSEDGQIFPNPGHLEESQQEPEIIAEKIIMEKYQEEEKKSGKNNILSQDIEFKLQEVLDDIKEEDGKNFQTIISLRMKELAYNKILVLTYEKSYFRLVQALFHIAKQYLRFDCYDQALHHLQNAIAKNVKAAETNYNKLYHSYILTALGECYFKYEKYIEALNELSRAENLQIEYESADQKMVNNIKTLTLLGKVKSCLKYEDAVKKIQQAVQKAKQLKGVRSRVYGLTLYEEGKLNRAAGKKEDAIKIYDRAIESIRMSNENEFEEDIIKIYQELAEIYEQLGNVNKNLETLKLRYQVFEDTYGNSDKKSIKEQRGYATALLKYKKIQESLQQFDDILQKQQKVYGQNSLQVGKQYRAIGNIHTAKADSKAAQANFKKALKIFHDLGDQRLARQIRMKISSLQMHQ